MPRSLSYALATSAMAASIGACALIVGVDGLTGGIDGGENGDASADGSANTDAQSDSGGDGGRVCDQQAPSVIFCQDFDGADAGLSSLQPTSQNGSVLIDNSFSKSPPRSLHITENTISNGSEENDITCSTSGTHSVLRLMVDFNVSSIGQINPNIGQVIASMYVSVPGQKNSPVIALNVTAKEVMVVETDPVSLDGEFHNPVSFNVADGQWHHAALLLDMTAAQAKYALMIDGNPIDSGSTIVSSWVPGNATAQIGLGYNNPPGVAFDGHFDNIIVDTK